MARPVLGRAGRDPERGAAPDRRNEPSGQPARTRLSSPPARRAPRSPPAQRAPPAPCSTRSGARSLEPEPRVTLDPELESAPGPHTAPAPQTDPQAALDLAAADAGERRTARLTLTGGVVGRMILAFVAGCLAITLLPILFGWRPYVVKSGSMEPGSASAT